MARGRSGRKTDYNWFSAAGDILGMDLAIATAQLGAGANSLLTFTAAQTVVRLRGQFFAQLDATAVDERVVIAVGLIVVSENAAGAGITSIPHPFTDSSEDWIWHGFMHLSSLAEGSVVNDALFDRQIIDSKAMRKVRLSEQLAFVAEVADSTDGGGTVDLTYGYRILSGL